MWYFPKAALLNPKNRVKLHCLNLHVHLQMILSGRRPLKSMKFLKSSKISTKPSTYSAEQLNTWANLIQMKSMLHITTRQTTLSSEATRGLPIKVQARVL